MTLYCTGSSIGYRRLERRSSEIPVTGWSINDLLRFFAIISILVCSVFGTSMSFINRLHLDLYPLIRKDSMVICSIFRTFVPMVPGLITKVNTTEIGG